MAIQIPLLLGSRRQSVRRSICLESGTVVSIPIHQVCVIADCLKNYERVYLVIRRIGTDRLGLVKGTIENGDSLRDAAKREALEEAGVVLDDDLRVVGTYSYRKQYRANPRQLFHVTVVKLTIVEVRERFREQYVRQRLFVSEYDVVDLLGNCPVAFILRLSGDLFGQQQPRNA